MSHDLLSWSAKQAFFETERQDAATNKADTNNQHTSFSALRIPAKAGVRRGEGATLGRVVSDRSIPAERDSQSNFACLAGCGVSGPLIDWLLVGRLPTADSGNGTVMPSMTCRAGFMGSSEAPLQAYSDRRKRFRRCICSAGLCRAMRYPGMPSNLCLEATQLEAPRSSAQVQVQASQINTIGPATD